MVIKPLQPDIDLPHLDLLSFLFESGCTLARDDLKLHIEAANPRNYITKADTRVLLKRIAHVLRHQYEIGAKGPGKDVVCLISSGSPILPAVFYGVVAAGGVFSGASAALTIGEISQQVEDGDTRLLLCSPEYKTLTMQTAERCGIDRSRVLVLDSSTPGRWSMHKLDGTDVIELGNRRELDWRRVIEERELENTTIALLYSSGTTGLPKGVRLSHWNIMSSCVCTMDPARRYQARHPDFQFDTVAHLPMANIAGIDMYCTNPIYMGGSTYWMKHYDFDLFVEYHRRYRPGYQFTVPPVWLRIAKSAKVTDHFDGLQVAVTGSAPIGDATAREVKSKLGQGKAVFTQTWGATEISGVIAALDWLKQDRWSVGDICPNLRLRMVDESDREIDPRTGQSGEVLITGPYMAQGYHNRPDANSETFVDGWYRTGDIGVYKDGHIWIVDRRKEMIKYKGQQVAPAELEGLLTAHSDIEDAAVIGIWDEKQETEVPRAFVVRKKQAVRAITADDVADYVKQNLAAHKQLRGGVAFVGQIPKSASGKILRKELRQEMASVKPKL